MDRSDLRNLEESVKLQGKRKRIETALLGSVSLLGLVSVAVLAPNVIQVLHKAFPDLRPVNQKQSVKRAIGRLIKSGYIEKMKVSGKYRMTSKGENRLHELTMLNGVSSNQKWDKKWRVVTYDIPEKESYKRKELRHALVLTGFI